MAPKKQGLYAERTNWVKAALRMLLGTLLVAGLAFFLGGLLYGMSVAISAALWVLVAGPVLVPPALWFFLKRQKKVKRLDLRSAENSELAQYYFESILWHPGPQPVFYVYETRDLSFLWFEKLSPWNWLINLVIHRLIKREQNSLGKSTQYVFLPSCWFDESKESRTADFAKLWSEIASSSPASRRLRTLQMWQWVAAMLPFEALFFCFQSLFNWLGADELPSLSFWSLRFFVALKGLWFGFKSEADPLKGSVRSLRVKVVRSLSSPCFSVWMQIPNRQLHPFWKTLSQSDIILT